MKTKDNAALRQQRLSLMGMSVRNANGDIDPSSMGYQEAITTLTYIKKQIVKQVFYTLPNGPAEFVPIAVGEGAFSQAILTNLSVSSSGKFEEGIINQGSGNDRLASATAGVTPVTVPVVNWAKTIGYSIIEVEQALRASNWDFLENIHKARKENWDLGIQEIAFLGAESDSRIMGLLNQSDVNINTSLITTPIKSMSASQFASFVEGLLAAYLSNCNQTTMPNMFTIPLSDFVGLAGPVSPDFPLVSKMKYLQDAFDAILGVGMMKIKATAYNNAAQNASRGINKNRYVLYKYDPETVRMDIPVDFTVTAPNTVNNFQFQDAAYGQFTGIKAYRPLEVLYLDETP